MKIGILTFYRNSNYGAMLQATALCAVLRNEGHEPVFLDTAIQTLHRRGFAGTAARFAFRLVSGNADGAMAAVGSFLRAKAESGIESYADPLPVSPPLRTMKALRKYAAGLDAAIVGSDQMWNPHWTAPFLPVVFLDFAPETCRRVAYAVSFSVPEWRQSNAGAAGTLMEKFRAIGVREKSGERIVGALCPGISARTTLDPTLLAGRTFWESKIPGEPDRMRKRHAFSYFLPRTSERDISKWNESAAALPGVDEVLDASAAPRGRLFARLCSRFGVHGKIGVDEWLRRLAESRFVVTNSFHGTAFAVIFHRPFASVLLGGGESSRDMNERIVSLLSEIGLEDRMVQPGSFGELKAIFEKPVDWSGVDAKLQTARLQSEKFLREALS